MGGAVFPPCSLAWGDLLRNIWNTYCRFLSLSYYAYWYCIKFFVILSVCRFIIYVSFQNSKWNIIKYVFLIGGQLSLHVFILMVLAKWKWKSSSRVWLFATPFYIVHGILKARILKWVAFPFSRWSSQPRDQTHVSHIAGGFFTSWATREAPKETWQFQVLSIFTVYKINFGENLLRGFWWRGYVWLF